MHLFYAVDALNIKKIEKKMNIFVCADFFRFFPLGNNIPITIFSSLVTTASESTISFLGDSHSSSVIMGVCSGLINFLDRS